MKMGDEKTFLNQATKWFHIQKTGMKVGMVSASALVVCGAVALGVAVSVKDSPKVETLPPSSIVSNTSIGASSALQSSTIVSTKQDATDSKADTSMKETASVASKDTTSQPTAESSAPTVSTVVAGAATSSTTSSSTTAANTNTVSVDFSQALKVNNKVKGQLYLPGTKMNNWVVLGTDNSFYLNHGLNNQKSGWGVPCIDFRTTLTKDARSTNIVIYGHSNDKTGEYFAPVKQYNKDGLEFYKQHPTIQFNTIYGDGNYKIIGMFLENVNVAGKSFGYHNFINAANEDEFNKFVNEVKGRSFLTMPVDTKYGDQLITLSTCLSTSSKNSRYVLVARKVRPGESAAVDVSQATVNANMIPPSGPLN